MLTAPPRGFALDPDRTLHQYNCQTWSRQNGLPVSGVHAIAQTADGYLWLGSTIGLIRFDGVKFTVVGLKPSKALATTRIQCLAVSRRGGLWFGVQRGAYGYYDGRGNWELNTDAEGGSDWDVPALLETPEGQLWLGGEKAGVRSLDNPRVQRFFAESVSWDFVTGFLRDSQRRFWIATGNQGLFYLQDDKPVAFAGQPPGSVYVHALAEDQEGQLWVGTSEGLVCYDAQRHFKEMGLPDHEVTALLVDRQGALWAGTQDHGLWRLVRGKWDSLRKIGGLADDSVIALAEDREGSLWVGTREGLNQLSDTKFPTFGLAEGLPDRQALSVSASPRGGLWAATPRGAAYFEHETLAYTVSTNAGLTADYVKRVLESRNGELYVLDGGNAVQILSAGRVVARHPTQGMPVAMVEDPEGVVVSVAGELFRVGRDYLTPYAFTNALKPPLYWVLNLTLGVDGAILVASIHGVCRVKAGGFEQWTESDGLGDNHALWVFQDPDGTIWAGLLTGIARIRGREIRNIRREHGLFDAFICSMVADAQGNFWIDSNRGLYRVSRAGLNAVADGRTPSVDCVSFDSRAAIKPGDKYAQEQSGCKTRDGRIWFPGSRGVIEINPAQVASNSLPPPVRVDLVCLNGIAAPLMDQIVVPPGRGELEFQYSALSYIAPEDIRFRYRLEGYDQDWIDAGSRRLAAYNNLRPGHYTFRVIACNADGVWNTTGDRVTVLLLPHFYQTAWFSLCALLAGVASLGGVYAWRINALKRREHDLEARVEDRTAELSQANDALTSEVRQRQQVQAEVEAQKARLEKEIDERKRMEVEIEGAHRQLMEASHQAGQAEVASSVLHNVGNVLNSVNVSAGLIHDRLRGLSPRDLVSAAALLGQHQEDLPEFLARDHGGQRLRAFLEAVGRHWTAEQVSLLKEAAELRESVEHIKQIVAMQQSLAQPGGVAEKLDLVEVIEGAIRMQSSALARHGIQLLREYDPVPLFTADRHQILQIVVNLLHNAQQACAAGAVPHQRVTIRIRRHGEDSLRIEVADNGVGIAPENLTRIFSHGFTTRKDGHGFGLHSGALAAKALRGTLTGQSPGVGQGATFTLEMPLHAPS